VLVVDSRDAGHVVARFNPLLIAAFTRVPSATELALIEALVEQAVRAELRGGMLYIVARRDMTGGVDPKVRETFERLTRRYEEASGSSAVVVLVRGFAGAVVRGALTGMLAVSRRRGALRVFGEIEAACAWMAETHGVSRDSLLAAVREATAQLPLAHDD
jgi:hypothetical protein